MRRVMVGIACGVVALLALDTGVWWFVCSRLQSGAEETVAAAQQGGWTLVGTPTHWGGWPFAASVGFDTVSAQAGPLAVPAGLVWTATTVDIRLSLWEPTMLTVLASGPQTITASGLPLVPFQSRRFALEVDLRGQATPRAVIDALDARLPAGSLKADAVEARMLPEGVALAANGVVLPDGPAVLPVIESVQGTVLVSPPFPIASTPAEGAAAWRSAGGRVALNGLAVRWAGLVATGQGSGGLDAALQPEGRAVIDAAGLPDVMDRLVQAGAIAPGAGVAAKAVLTLLAAPARGGPVSLPVTLGGGLLRVAGIALLRVAPLAWH